MIVRQVMSKNLVMVKPTEAIHEAAKKMMEGNVGAVLVVDEGSRVRGILTDRDIAMTVAANSRDLKTACICEVMVQDPITIEADADLDSAVRIMRKANIRRLPVTETGKVVGIISSADIASAMKCQFNMFFGLEEAFAKI